MNKQKIFMEIVIFNEMETMKNVMSQNHLCCFSINLSHSVADRDVCL